MSKYSKMNKGLKGVFPAILLSTTLISTHAYSAPSLTDELKDSWIVVFNEGVERKNVKSEARNLARGNGKLGYVYTNTIKGFSITIPEHALRQLVDKNPKIAYAERDSIASIVKRPSNKGGGGSTPQGQETPWGISRVGGSSSSWATGRIYVIDSGVQSNHPDLNVVGCENFVTRGKWTCEDGNGHGTHVAGTIAANDNDFGVIGVAAGAPIVGIRVLDNQGNGAYSWVIAGIDYVAGQVGNGRTVANLSLGGPASDTLDNAVRQAAEAGVQFSIAAGNLFQDANNYSPSRVEHPNVYTVSAIDVNDKFASFSNFGSVVDFAAPGVAIKSTWIGNGYNTISGTSMAAPHVAGLLMLGPVSESGNAVDDPDGVDDPIAHQ